jgi:hypothetical protein
MTTVEFFDEVRARLTPDGVVAMNLYVVPEASAARPEGGRVWAAFLRTLSRVFAEGTVVVYAPGAIERAEWNARARFAPANLIVLAFPRADARADLARLDAAFPAFRDAGGHTLAEYARAVWAPADPEGFAHLVAAAPTLTDAANPIRRLVAAERRERL